MSTYRQAGLIGLLLLATAPLGPSLVPADPRGADGQFDKRRSTHFVLYQDVAIDRRSGWYGSVRFERELLGALEAAYDRLDQYLGLRPQRTITVVVYDPRVFDHQFASLLRFPAAGFFQGVIRIRGDTQVTFALERVLHHELVHAALHQAAPSSVLPAWLNEGLAEWFEARAFGKRGLSGHELGALARAHRRGALLPLAALMPPTLGHLDPATVGLGYLQSYGLIDHLARRSGEGSLRELCDGLARRRSLERVLSRVYGLDLGELERSFADSLGAPRGS